MNYVTFIDTLFFFMYMYIYIIVLTFLNTMKKFSKIIYFRLKFIYSRKLPYYINQSIHLIYSNIYIYYINNIILFKQIY